MLTMFREQILQVTAMPFRLRRALRSSKYHIATPPTWLRSHTTFFPNFFPFRCSQQPLRLWEFFVVDVDAALDVYKKTIPDMSNDAFRSSSSDIICRDPALGRFNASLNCAAAALALGRETSDNPVTDEEYVGHSFVP
jgi:hypothetical protein